MSLNINSNFAAISNGALTAMKQSQTIMGKSINHVSTGKKVNSAVDGASAYVSAQLAKSDAQGYNGLNSSIQNGSSYLNAADKAMSSIVDMLSAMREKSLEYNSYSDKTSDAALAAKNAFSSLYDAAKAAINVDVGTQDRLISENQDFVFTMGFGETDDVGPDYVGTNKSKSAGFVAGDMGVMQNTSAGEITTSRTEGLVAKKTTVIDSTGMSNKYTIVYNGTDGNADVEKSQAANDANAIFANTTTGVSSIATKTGYIVDGAGNIRFKLAGGQITEGKNGTTVAGAYSVSKVTDGTNISIDVEDIKWKKDYVAKNMAATDSEARTLKNVFTDPQKLKSNGNVSDIIAKDGIKVDDTHTYSIYFSTKTSTGTDKVIPQRYDGDSASPGELTLTKGTGVITGQDGREVYDLEDGQIKDATTSKVVGSYNLDDDGVFSLKWTKEFVGRRGDVSGGGGSASLTVSWNSISDALDNLDIDDSAGIANAIKQVSREQAKVGNGLNTLEHVSSHLTSMANVETEAYTTLTEADMAEEMTNYVKNNIYSQAAQAMIAQANQSMAQVLNLLQ